MSKLKHNKGFYDSGELRRETWRLNGKHHNEEGPAYIWYRKDGSVDCEGWYLDGELHNEAGPAYIGYREDGSIRCKWWWLDGVKYTEEEWKDLVFRQVFEEVL